MFQRPFLKYLRETCNNSVSKVTSFQEGLRILTDLQFQIKEISSPDEKASFREQTLWPNTTEFRKNENLTVTIHLC